MSEKDMIELVLLIQGIERARAAQEILDQIRAPTRDVEARKEMAISACGRLAAAGRNRIAEIEATGKFSLPESLP